MSNITVQEALKAAIRFARINPHVGMYENSNSNHVVYGAELAKTFEAALSDIEKCEPVAEVRWRNGEMFAKFKTDFVEAGTKLYTSPQPRDWVSLSEAEIYESVDDHHETFFKLARAIEVKLKQLNTTEKG